MCDTRYVVVNKKYEDTIGEYDKETGKLKHGWRILGKLENVTNQ